MKKKIVCLLLAAVLTFAVPVRALAFGFAIPLAVEEVVIMLLGLCGITVSDDFDVEQFIDDVQEQLDEAGTNLSVAAYLSGIAASKVLNTVAVDYAEIFAAVLDVGNSQASSNAGGADYVATCPRLQTGTLYLSGRNDYYMYGGKMNAQSQGSAPSTCDVYVANISDGKTVFFALTADLVGYNYICFRRFNMSRFDALSIYTTSGDYSLTEGWSGYALSEIATFLSAPTFSTYQSLLDALADIDNGGAVAVSDDVINGNATDIDYNSVNDRGVLTGAFSIDLGAIADAFGSIADAWSGVRENVRSWADVVSAGRVIPSIDDKVIEDTQANESVISNTTVAEAAASIGDVGDYNLGLENFFPFCLPWDLYNFITLLEATPEAPVIEWEFPVDVEGNTEHYEWSLEDLEYLAEILRTFLTLAFAVGLIFVGGKLFKH